MSRLLGTLELSLTSQSGILPNTIFLFQSVRVFIFWTRFIQSIKRLHLPLLVPDIIPKHSSFRFPFSIIDASPWIGLYSWLDRLLPSIYVASRLKELVLLILAQRVPLIWAVVATLRVKYDTLGTTVIVGTWCCIYQWPPVIHAWLFYKVLLQRDTPAKILNQAFIRHDAGINQVEASSLDALTEVPDLGSLANTCVTMILQYL